MKSPKFQLGLAAALFVAWIGWLVYLALTNVKPIVLSRPQFLAANLFIVAEVKEGRSAEQPAREVVVREVIWSADQEDKKLPEKDKLVVANLTECGQRFGWAGANEYILALTKTKEADKVSYEVTLVPRSPGYWPPPPNPKSQLTPSPIYPATPQTLRQARALVAEFHGN